MTISTLEHCSVSEITNTFNEAFQDYVIRIELTEESMQAKMKSEGISLAHSFGAFDDGKLVGLILHGCDTMDGEPWIYNGGTGVIPLYRGKSIVQKIYDHCFPILAKQGYKKHVLEVIETNHRAFHIYQKTGFKVTRTLGVYQLDTALLSSQHFVEQLDEIPYDLLQHSEIRPAWQNSIERAPEMYRMLGIKHEGEVVAFAAFVAGTGKIRQFLVHREFRRRGMARALMAAVQEEAGGAPLLVVNVDENYAPMKLFLQKMGFARTLGQHEMQKV